MAGIPFDMEKYGWETAVLVLAFRSRCGDDGFWPWAHPAATTIPKPRAQKLSFHYSKIQDVLAPAKGNVSQCELILDPLCSSYHTQPALPRASPPKGNKTCILNCNYVGKCLATVGSCQCPAGEWNPWGEGCRDWSAWLISSRSGAPLDAGLGATAVHAWGRQGHARTVHWTLGPSSNRNPSRTRHAMGPCRLGRALVHATHSPAMQPVLPQVGLRTIGAGRVQLHRSPQPRGHTGPHRWRHVCRVL